MSHPAAVLLMFVASLAALVGSLVTLSPWFFGLLVGCALGCLVCTEIRP